MNYATELIVYIAAPYTKGDVAQNINRVIKVADELVTKGYIPYLPHLTHFWHLVSPKPYGFWIEYDTRFLLKCDCVLRLEGESWGADKEVTIARKLGIPVYFSIEEMPEQPAGLH